VKTLSTRWENFTRRKWRWDYPFPPFPIVSATKYGDELPALSGVYFVWDSIEDIVYVGQSINLKNRARLDKNEYRIQPGDKISYLLFPKEALNFAESFYIGICVPKRNYQGLYERHAENLMKFKEFKWTQNKRREYVNCGIDI
jgi:hypothetical protein